MPTIATQTDHWNDVEKPALMLHEDWDIEKGEWKQSEPPGCGLAVALEVLEGFDWSSVQESQSNEALDEAHSDYQAELEASGERFMTTQEANDAYGDSYIFGLEPW